MTSGSTPSKTCPERRFAVVVVQRLRAAGFEALWAGGCVRDALLGILPKDYDVATNATPAQVIELFGEQKTIPVGASFGVVIVRGRNQQEGQIEVATFRTDGEYHDGRRPTSVTFCTAEEDAKRRDFTINGMFFDPVSNEIIDYVGGQADLKAGCVRAIGNAADRFEEDKLRMLRAVRFAATFQFELESSTVEAIRKLRSQLDQVSAERVTQELRRMLSDHTRTESVTHLVQTGLIEYVFPSVFSPKALEFFPKSYFDVVGNILRELKQPRFEPSLVVLMNCVLQPTSNNRLRDTTQLRAICRIMKLSNEESDCVVWLAKAGSVCRNADNQPLHIIKPILADRRVHLLLDLLHAVPTALDQKPSDAKFLREYLKSTPVEILNPESLIDGTDLIQHGLKAGPVFKRILSTIRNEQLDEKIVTRAAALQRMNELTSSKADNEST